MSDRRFSGKVALITGGSSGIGLATAIRFAREGAKVVIAGRGTAKGQAAQDEIVACGEEAEFVATDVSQSGQVQALIERTLERFGRLDYAFNNAAAMEAGGTFKPLAAVSEEEFDAHIGLNLKSVWLCMKYEILAMLQQGSGGAIVNTSSVNGLGGVANNALYSASKSGVLGLTKSAAQEYADRGIRINAVVPGAFRTPMLESVFERISPGDWSAAERGYERLIPIKRVGRPEEAAEAVLWLCSDGSSYVTGHSLIVDGGLSSAFR